MSGLTLFGKRKEQLETWKREDEVARRAQDVAVKLSISNKLRDLKLVKLQETADGTHAIVNSQRTMLLRLNAELRERIARENPKDTEAQEAAIEARQEANKAALRNQDAH